jgi:topoisomerase IA-like protein
MEKKKGETLGEYKGKEIKLLEGQYGKYIKYGDANISLYKLKNKTDLESVIAYLENPENQNAEGGETPAKKPFKPFKKNFKK